MKPPALLETGRALLLTLACLSASCSGSGESTAISQEPPPPTPVAGALCAVPALPVRPTTVVDVRSFGAVPDDGGDDTVAIQRAIDSLAVGQWLVFPAGVYEHSSRLNVRTSGVVLWSEGASLRATNPGDQAVVLGADGASIYNFTLTAVTNARRDAPWQSRIAVFDPAPRSVPLRGNVVQGNRVVEDATMGAAGANSASSAGIYIEFAENFVVANNEVRRSLSDGIHITGGARNGRVLSNRVRETGDDMIGIVSYMSNGDWTSESAAAVAAALDSRRDRQLVHNVLVADNDVSGQYFGRGITVVGGADITLRNNRIAQTSFGAGLLLAREASFVTWGVRNVLAEDNIIIDVQTTAPAYTAANWDSAQALTGHAAVEIHSFVFDDERPFAALLQATAVENVRVTGTSVNRAGAAGVRVGVGTGQSFSLSTTGAIGQPRSRSFSGGLLRQIELSNLALQNTAQAALQILTGPPPQDPVYCEALTDGGLAITAARCGGVRPLVTGASQGCSR